jgi:hypothetical protein
MLGKNPRGKTDAVYQNVLPSHRPKCFGLEVVTRKSLAHHIDGVGHRRGNIAERTYRRGKIQRECICMERKMLSIRTRGVHHGGNRQAVMH